MRHKLLLIPSLTLITAAPIMTNVGCSKNEFHWDSVDEERALVVANNIKDQYHEWVEKETRFKILNISFDQTFDVIHKGSEQISHDTRVYEFDVDNGYRKAKIDGYKHAQYSKEEYSYNEYDITYFVDGIYNAFLNASTLDYCYDVWATTDKKEDVINSLQARAWNIFLDYGYGIDYNYLLNPEIMLNRLHQYSEKYKTRQGYYFNFWFESKNDKTLRVLIDSKTQEIPFGDASENYEYCNYKVDFRVENGLISYIDKICEYKTTPELLGDYTKEVLHVRNTTNIPFEKDNVDIEKFHKRG